MSGPTSDVVTLFNQTLDERSLQLTEAIERSVRSGDLAGAAVNVGRKEELMQSRFALKDAIRRVAAGEDVDDLNVNDGTDDDEEDEI